MPHVTDDPGAASAAGVPLRGVLVLAALAGALAAVVVAFFDYTLAYNDARARLVVARRVFDSLTPGIDQMGGIWLPLPHLLNLPLVQSDFLYRTGFGMVAINLAAFVGLVAATVTIATRLTGRPWAGLAAAALVVSHPDLLYLQATPMTEMLTLGMIAGAIALLSTPGQTPWRHWCAAGLLALAMVTRYEAWPVAAAIVAVVAWAHHPARGAGGWRRHPVRPMVVLGGAALAGAAMWNRMMTGSWLVTSDFFPQTVVAGRPLLALGEVGRIALQAAGPGLLILAGIGAVLMAREARRSPVRRMRLLAAAPLSAAVLYFSLALAGHPVLNRFAVLLLVPVIWIGVSGAVALGNAGRVRTRAALLALVVAWQAGVWVLPPVIREARVDVQKREPFTEVVEAFDRMNGEERLLASMWTTASVLHELSTRGVPLRRVIHEGNGEMWRLAMTRPADHVAWILVACQAGDADRVARGLAALPAPLAAFDVAARSEGLELYRLRPAGAASASAAAGRYGEIACTSRASEGGNGARRVSSPWMR